MIKEGKFGAHEAIWLLTITIAAKVFFTSPALVATTVGTAGWYMTLISGTVAFFVLFLVCRLFKLFPDNNIMKIYDIVWGKMVGSCFTMFFGLMLFTTAAINLREFVEVMKVYVFPLSPPTYLISLFIIVVILLSYLGLETMARFSKLVAYILLGAYIVVLILSFRLFDIHRLYPLLGHGLGKTVLHGISRSSAYGQILIAAIIADSLYDLKYLKKISYISLILSTVIISSALMTFSLVFPYYIGEEITAPMYLMSSLIEYGIFFQRIEPIFLFIWNISIIVSIAVSFYISLLCYAYVFRLDDKRPLILPWSIIFMTLVIIPMSITQVTNYLMQALREFGWILWFIPPIITTIAATIKKGRLQK